MAVGATDVFGKASDIEVGAAAIAFRFVRMFTVTYIGIGWVTIEDGYTPAAHSTHF